MNRIYELMSERLITRFLYFFLIHLTFWFIVFEVLYAVWPDHFPDSTLRNLALGGLLGTIFTILLHGVKILSGPERKKSN